MVSEVEDSYCQETSKLLDELKLACNNANNFFAKICEDHEGGLFESQMGISLFDLKNQMLSSYLLNMALLFHSKVEGTSFTESKNKDYIHNLVEFRTVFERIRPIEKKLDYQVEKLLKRASSQQISENDPLGFKPNAANFADDSESGSDGAADVTKSKASKIYMPPRVAAMQFEEGSERERLEKKLNQSKVQALRGEVLNDLLAEHSETPREIRDTDVNESRRRRLVRLQEHEENNMLRFTVSRKERIARQKLDEVEDGATSLSNITKFHGFSRLDASVDNEESLGKKKKRKISSGKKNSKSRKFKKM